MRDWVDEKLGQLASIEIGGTPARERTEYRASPESGLGATTSPHVNVGDIRKRLFLCPSRDEQESIGLQLTTLQAKLAADETEAKQHRALKSGLMHDLLTGRVSVVIERGPDPQEAAAHV